MAYRNASKGVFNRFGLSEKLERRTDNIKQAVGHLNADHLLDSSTEDLVAEIISEHDAVPREIVWVETEQLLTSETTMVSVYPERWLLERCGPGSTSNVAIMGVALSSG